MLFQTDVVLMNLEAGQKPKLTAEWDKRSLSHSRGSLLWQASRWPFVEITNQIRERERVRGRCTFSTTARPPTQIAFSCCHGKNVLIKTERKFTRTFFRCCFLSSCSIRQVERYHSPVLPVSICVSVTSVDLCVTSEWPLSDLCVTSVDLCWPGELQIIGVNSVTSQNNSAVFCIIQWELSLFTATETWAEISCVYFNVNIQTDELYNRGQHIVFDACNYIVIVSWPDIFKLCFLCFWWLMVLCQCCLSPW